MTAVMVILLEGGGGRTLPLWIYTGYIRLQKDGFAGEEQSKL